MHRPRAMEHALALAASALVFLICATAYPFLGFSTNGQLASMTLLDSAVSLINRDALVLGIIVFVLIFAAPLLLLILLTLPSHHSAGRHCVPPHGTAGARRARARRMEHGGGLSYRRTCECSQNLVHGYPAPRHCVLGVHRFRAVHARRFRNAGSGFNVVYHPHPDRTTVTAAGSSAPFPEGTAAAAGLTRCTLCATLAPTGQSTCEVCGRSVHLRKPRSIQISLALLITACILYVPANVLPIMTTTEFGSPKASTIVEGVWLLLSHGSYPTALIIFIASVFVPIAKIAALFWLSVAVLRGDRYNIHQKNRLFHVVEFVGRWSMVDVFVVALLVALVQLGGVLSVTPGPAALAFCGVVVFTMLAADLFDQRLLWDAAGPTATVAPMDADHG